MDNEYMQLSYLPSNFEVDKRFLSSRQEEDLKNFISKRYMRNKDNMQVITNNVTKAFIRNGSNIYSKEVQYPDWENKNWVKRRKREINLLEKYFNLNKQALFWTYKKNDKPKFKALHASEYVVSVSAEDEIRFVIVRVGQFLKQTGKDSSEIWYNFKMWKDGKVYKTQAEYWDTLPSSEQGWQQDDVNPNYKKLPFTLVSDGYAKPSLSPLPVMEMILAGGASWGDISAQLTFLKQIYGITDLSKSEWKKLVDQIKLFSIPDLGKSADGNSNTLNTLDLGDGKAQRDWQEFIKEPFKRLAYSEGVDINGLFSDIKVESGVARRLAMENIIAVRNSKIGLFEEFEERDQEVLIDLKIVNKESEVIYSDLDIGETRLDKETIEEKRQVNILNRYKAGTITKIEMIMEMEGLSEQEAKAKYRAITAERTGSKEIDFPSEEI